jgi:hypothetical protein
MAPRKKGLACALATGALLLGGTSTASGRSADDEISRLNGAEQTLPFSGSEPAWVAGAGLLLVAAGMGIRRLGAGARA